MTVPSPVESLTIQGSHVRSSQRLAVPLVARNADVATERSASLRAEDMVGRYATFIRTWTHGIVRTAWRDGNLCLTLVARRGPHLLCLRPSARGSGTREVPGSASLSIVSGLAAAPLVQGGELVLRVAVHRPDAKGSASLDVEVLVDGYAPALLALPLPRSWRLALYRATQARVHKAITFAFLHATVRYLLEGYQAGPPRSPEARSQCWR